MSVFISFAILALALLIITFLYLTPGVFAFLYHYCQGRFGQAKAQELSTFFILGAETISSCIFLLTFILVAFFTANFPHDIIPYLAWFMFGLFIALAFSSLFFYFRRGAGTELFISRKTAKEYIVHAKTTKDKSGAFCLGIVSEIPELLFTLPLYIIISSEILRISTTHPASLLLTILYIIVPVIPLFIIRFQFKHHQNLADIERSRIHNKNFTRIILSISYLIIAFLILSFRT